jgi:hypothetical protein
VGRFKTEEDVSEELAFATLSAKPWKYAVTVPSAIVTAPAVPTATRLQVVGLATALGAALVAVLFSLTVTRQIVRFARAADAVSMGDTNASVDIRSNE